MPVTSDSDRDPRFEAEVLERHPDPIEIYGQHFSPLDVLLSDASAYAEACQAFLNEERESTIDHVLQNFPFPIAYLLSRYLSGHEQQLERIGFLKDVWEAMVTTVFSLVLVEARAIRAKIIAPGVRPRAIESWSIFDRLELVRCIRDCSAEGQLCRRIVTDAGLEAMLSLNRRRNEDLAHVATLSDRQSRMLADELEPQVLHVLRELSALADVELVRYVAPDRAQSHRLQVFRGASPAKRVDHQRMLEQRQLVPMVERQMSTEELFAICPGIALPTSPFIVLSSDDSSRLAALKKCDGAGGLKTLHYEEFGLMAGVWQSNNPRWLLELEEMRSLFASPGKKLRKRGVRK